ncbi:hypothetical protein Tco_1020282, partial [Tanacetum coccineum]
MRRSGRKQCKKKLKPFIRTKCGKRVPLLGGRKPIGNKWVYKIKRNNDDQAERYHARLVIKDMLRK